MPCQRAKLYQKTGKVKTVKQQKSSNNQENKTSPNNAGNSSSSTPNNNESNGQSNNQQSSTAEQQFMIELYWCVKQLENSLNSDKLTQKQSQDIEKSLKILKSSNQPIIKKRQMMRSLFGDYRLKMAEEEKKMSLGLKQIKFTTNRPNVKGNSSHFIKKSAFLTSGKNFKFDFPVKEIEHLSIVNSKEQVQHHQKDNVIDSDNQKESTNIEETVNTSNFKFIPSGNSFKFNFKIDT